jgi:hypothetical protein
MSLFESYPAFNTLSVLKYLTLSSFITIFCGCNVTLKTVNMTQPGQHYKKIVVMVLNTRSELKDFSERSFDSVVNPVFNNLKDLEVRTKVEKSLAKGLASPGTTVVKSSDIFKLHEDVSYSQYLNRLKDNNIEAVLILGLSTHWSGSGKINNGTAEKYPIFSFLYYLIDIKSTQQVWLATDWSHFMIDDASAEDVGTMLNKAGFIEKPRFREAAY